MYMRQLLMTAGCIFFNLALGKIAVVLALPVYLDSVATIFSTALLPWYLTLAIAVLTSVAGALVIDPNLIAYIGTQLTIALVAIFCFRSGLLNSWWESLFSGLVLAVSAAVVSAPVTVLLFGGVTWSETTAVTSFLNESGKGLWQSVVQGAIFIECIDKIGATLLAYLLLRCAPLRQKVEA